MSKYKPEAGDVFLSEYKNHTEHLAVILDPKTQQALTACGVPHTYYGHMGDEPKLGDVGRSDWFVLSEEEFGSVQRIKDETPESFSCEKCRKWVKRRGKGALNALKERQQFPRKMKFERENFE